MRTNSLTELACALAQKKISSVELTQHFLERIELINPEINAFITVNAEKSLAAAKWADEQIARGQSGALLGIPIAQKDLVCTKDWATTCASKMLANFVSPYDAHIMENFNRDGAILLGKTNLDEFAMGSSNETSYFGAVKNPWDISCVAGGSSGGSAAAVAAGLAPAATGSDTGGSIRQPAALCGLSGIKPTYGVISRYGLVAFASSLDQGGAMAHSAEDCAILLNTMAGFDVRDSTSLERPKEDYLRDLSKPLQGLKIGVPEEFFNDAARAGCHPEIMAEVEKSLEEYVKLGAEKVAVQLPHMQYAVHVYYVTASAEASTNLARFDGVRYGHRANEYANLEELYRNSRTEGFGAEVKRRILMGTYVLSQGYYDAYYLKAQRVRRLITQDFIDAFKTCDVILGPTTPYPAFKLGERIDDPIKMYLSDIYTVAVNLAGLPAMSIPCGFTSDDNPLPIGLQLIGNYFSESRLLNVAHVYQQQTDWHLQMPNLL